MTIHHFINSIGSAPGGAERIALSLHQGLLDRGIDSRLLTLKDEKRTEPGFTSLGLINLYSMSTFFKIRAYVKSNCSKNDIVHTHLFPTNLFTGHAALGWGCRVVTTEHSTHNRRREKWWGKVLDRQIYRRYCRIFCISEGTKKAIEEWQPKVAGKTVVVNNGVDLNFDQMPTATCNDIPVIVSIGRLHPSKNYETALRALATLNDLDFVYKIAGAGAKETDLRKLAIELGLENKVQFLGYVDSPAELLASSDIFLITSLWEGFGLAAVEAMNAGLPLIASKIAGLKEVVGPDCGVLVDPSSSAEIAEAVRNLLQDKNKRTQMRLPSFERARLFSAEKMVSNYINHYKILAEVNSGNGF